MTGDGSVEAFSSTQDIGTGTRTILAQVVAEEFGLRPEDDRLPYRGLPLSDGAGLGRQPRHQLPDARRPQRRVPLRP